MLSDPIACPRCHATDVAATDCAACGAISWIACRACGQEGCRDLLCELRSHDRAFRKRLAAMVTMLVGMTAAMLLYGAPLKEVSLTQVAGVRTPEPGASSPEPGASSPDSGLRTPEPALKPPAPSPAPEDPPPASSLPPPASLLPPPASLLPPPASLLPPPASLLPPPASHFQPAPLRPPPPTPPSTELVPGLDPTSSPDGRGFWVQDIDEADLRAGRPATASPRTVSPYPEASNSPVSPAHAPYPKRLESVLKESLAARYSPNGTSLRTGLSPGGLVHWVFRRLGVPDVPANIAEQMTTLGDRVDPRDYRPEPGDLLFFKIGALYHVGIYFEKDQNTFLTVVPSKGGVVVADWDHAFFRSRFLFARRLVPPGL